MSLLTQVHARNLCKKIKEKTGRILHPLYQYRNFNYLHLTMVFGDLVREGSLFDKKERKI